MRSGEWRLNVDLSDDPEKGGADQLEPRFPQPGGGRGDRGIGMPPEGIPGHHPGGEVPESDDLVSGQSSALTPPRHIVSAAPLEEHVLVPAADHLSIKQSGGTITVTASDSNGHSRTEQYVSGQKGTIPYGQGTAERQVGWRGDVLVVTTKPDRGPFREDDYAVGEEDGRLIVSTLIKGGFHGKSDLKRVYDRVKG